MNVAEAIRILKALLSRTDPESQAALMLIDALKLLDPELHTEGR